MASGMISEFLESSTIHGLVEISTSSTRSLRAIWIIIVVASFASAIYMITSSYKEWHESPVSTTITTHPIDELEFPAVTVCPPRGSNTALNHALNKAKEVNFTDRERQKLINLSREIFIEGQTKNHAKEISELLGPGNIRSIVSKQADLPLVDKFTNMVSLKSWEFEGSFSTPGFGDPDCKGNFFERPHSFHYEIKFPDDIKDVMGDGGDLVISVETKDKWSFRWNKNKMQLFNEELNMSDAEDFCKSEGKHLASITSNEEQIEVQESLPSFGPTVWLGGKKDSEEQSWHWLDGRKWGFEGKWEGGGAGGEENTCLSLQTRTDWSHDFLIKHYTWKETNCNEAHSFVCLDATNTTCGQMAGSGLTQTGHLDNLTTKLERTV